MNNEKVCTLDVNNGGAWSNYYPLVDANTYKAGEGCSVVVRARQTNTGLIYIAKNLYASKVAPFRLSPGEAIELRIKDLSQILVGAEVSGDAVNWIVEL
ncbi:MAG: hypothetical protein CH104c_0506 [Candidatus Woesebacteria bacterium]|nr:MAG: hypothetical protein CH104c_0506 [Candidatus Woesebacteria bacterium]